MAMNYDFDPIVSPYNGHMLRNLSKYYLLICCKQGSSTHFCHFLATAFVTDVLAGSNPMHWAQKRKAPIAGSLISLVVGDEGCRVRLAPPAPRFVAPLLACCAGKRFAFPQLRTLSGSNPGVGEEKARHHKGNGLCISNGAPSGIRTRDIHLERVASLAARRWGQRERV